MTNEMINKCEAAGMNRWTKGNYDRLYINASLLGLECKYYKTGNISDATLNGVRVSNCEARRLKAAKVYVDVATGKVVGDNDTLVALAEQLLNSIIAESEETAEETVEETSVDTVVNQYGIEIPYNVAEQMMDTDIREDLHLSFDRETEQEFFDEYCKLHAERLGEEFILDTKNPQF